MNVTLLSDGSEVLRYREPAVPLYTEPGRLSCFAGKAALCHWHEEVELLLALRGHLSYRINGQEIVIREGDALFVNSRQLHYGFSADGMDCGFFCVVFQPQLLCASEALQARYILPILEHTGTPYLLLRRDDAPHQPLLALLKRLADMADRCQAPPTGCELETLGVLAQFWQGLYGLLRPALTHTFAADADAQAVRNMLEFIHQHYAERVTLEQVAQAGHVCRSKCCQLFRQYLGHTLVSYLQSYRLERGTAMLKETELSVSQIAYACGFCSGSYFTELFTRYKGCAPTAYRRLLQASATSPSSTR